MGFSREKHCRLDIKTSRVYREQFVFQEMFTVFYKLMVKVHTGKMPDSIWTHSGISDIVKWRGSYYSPGITSVQS